MSENEKWANPKKVRCLVCDTVGNWQNVDSCKIKPTGMSLCNTCGFVTHMSNLKSKEELTEYYRKDYRAAPTGKNFFTGERKIHYHHAFLIDHFKPWLEKQGEGIVVGEVGAAYGMFLSWVKNIMPKADVSGAELTTSYRRVAAHEYGIRLDEELDLTKKYDLIASYKVAEHQMDVDKELIKLKEALKDDGRIYISVPIWFSVLNNFGGGGWDLEYYYHPNHINVWSEKLFETVLKKVGLEIVKKDNAIYDTTYLCKRNDALMNEKPEYDIPENRIEELRKIKAVHNALVNKDPEAALYLWPYFPQGHAILLEQNRPKFNKIVQEKGFDAFHDEVLLKVLKDCNDHPDAVAIVSEWCMRYSDWTRAVGYIEKAIQLKPGSPLHYLNRAKCFAFAAESMKGKEKYRALLEALATLKELRKISAQTFEETTTWIYKIESMIPLKSELESIDNPQQGK